MILNIVYSDGIEKLEWYDDGSYFVNEDGELMMAYHGETDINSNLRCDGIRRVHFRKNNTPYFKMSQDEDLIDTDVIIRLKK